MQNVSAHHDTTNYDTTRHCCSRPRSAVYQFELLCVANDYVLRYCKTFLLIVVYIYVYNETVCLDDNIYASPWELSILRKEFTAAARIMQSSSNELSTLVSGKV